ncbi:nucleotidyl transferase AbiEii/AbiGii toxin family protein [Subsaximicrobium wynnwilliamsii]|uniref:nucleotidyl transferase AbiEii/AbiGii toxin family protein n=1 Tax=Subsaximicrobium wynnwilliamsii TaxID=291179 RepID=UPI001CB9374C|nr:nucleotidyl transferase AbiEii/AbiGii toxin family protein [Subsaximicrobium wynnwilliamsii]
MGGTSLSLQLGHRTSIDIDLFTDSEYGSVDFAKLETILTETFSYVESSSVRAVLKERIGK